MTQGHTSSINVILPNPFEKGLPTGDQELQDSMNAMLLHTTWGHNFSLIDFELPEYPDHSWNTLLFHREILPRGLYSALTGSVGVACAIFCY